MNNHVSIFFYLPVYLWNKIPRVGFAGSKGKCTYTVLIHSQTPLHQDIWQYHIPHSLPNRVYCWTFQFCQSNKKYLSVVLICIPFTMLWIEHHYIWKGHLQFFFCEFCTYLLPIFPKDYWSFSSICPSFIKI